MLRNYKIRPAHKSSPCERFIKIQQFNMQIEDRDQRWLFVEISHPSKKIPGKNPGNFAKILGIKIPKLRIPRITGIKIPRLKNPYSGNFYKIPLVRKSLFNSEFSNPNPIPGISGLSGYFDPEKIPSRSQL